MAPVRSLGDGTLLELFHGPTLAFKDVGARFLAAMLGLFADASRETVVLVGVPTPDKTITLPLIDVFGRGGALKSSWYGDCLPSRDFPMLVDLYRQGRFDLDAFVTERIGINDVEAAFAKMHDGSVLRSVVIMEEGK